MRLWEPKGCIACTRMGSSEGHGASLSRWRWYSRMASMQGRHCTAATHHGFWFRVDTAMQSKQRQRQEQEQGQKQKQKQKQANKQLVLKRGA